MSSNNHVQTWSNTPGNSGYRQVRVWWGQWFVSKETSSGAGSQKPWHRIDIPYLYFNDPKTTTRVQDPPVKGDRGNVNKYIGEIGDGWVAGDTLEVSSGTTPPPLQDAPPVISNPRLSNTTFSSKGGKVTVSATVTDDKGVTSAWALINGATRIDLKRTGSTSSYSATWQAPKNTGTSARTYTIDLYARDTAGNQTGPVQAGTVTVQGKGKKQGALEGDEDPLALKPGAPTPLTLRLLAAAGERNGAARVFVFILSKSARVEARLLSPTGKLVRRFEGREARAGLNSLVWEGKTQSGAVAARGLYLLELLAADEEGQQVRAAQTVVVR
ncbi:MAG: Ig-like domain-containing protein [Abditibacteriales bacterium]|nr:Ig-like domain-containing protein [Abditibacteriales bacterium]